MDNNDKVAYFEEKERMWYQHTKDVQKTLRWAFLSILGAFVTLVVCVTAILCCYMYYVVPREEEVGFADNGSQIVVHSTVSGDNTNGL